MAISCFWRQATDSQSRPDIGIGVQDTDVVEVAVLNVAALVEPTVLELRLSELKPTVYDEVVADQDGGMSLSGSWSGATALWALPGHDLKVEHIYIIIIVFAIPASKHVHFGATNYIGGVIEPRWWCTSATWALVPSHGDRIESV